jgi:hypothetical protein
MVKSLAKSTVAPAMTAPVGSATLPRTVPALPSDWQNVGSANNRNTRQKRTIGLSYLKCVRNSCNRCAIPLLSHFVDEQVVEKPTLTA